MIDNKLINNKFYQSTIACPPLRLQAHPSSTTGDNRYLRDQCRQVEIQTHHLKRIEIWIR